jgi:hypothetical protein
MHSLAFVKAISYVAYASIALLGLGMLVTRQTFLRMRWKIERPQGWRAMLSGVWVSRATANKIENRYQALDSHSKLFLTNRIARVSVIVGIVGLIGSLLTMWITITR